MPLDEAFCSLQLVKCTFIRSVDPSIGLRKSYETIMDVLNLNLNLCSKDNAIGCMVILGLISAVVLLVIVGIVGICCNIRMHRERVQREQVLREQIRKIQDLQLAKCTFVQSVGSSIGLSKSYETKMNDLNLNLYSMDNAIGCMLLLWLISAVVLVGILGICCDVQILWTDDI